MKLLISYFKVYTLEILRNKQAAFFSIFFPAILLLLFGKQDYASHAQGTINQIAVLAVYCIYAAQSVALMSLGISISTSRNSDWSLYLRTLPVAPGVSFGGLLLSTAARAFISVVIVLLIGIFYLGAQLSVPTLSYIVCIAMIGIIPMGLLAIGLGYLVNSESARSVFVIVNLMLLFGSFSLPSTGFFGYARSFIPSFQWVSMVVNHYIPTANLLSPWLWMLGFTIAFYFLATWAYHRQRNTRFS